MLKRGSIICCPYIKCKREIAEVLVDIDDGDKFMVAGLYRGISQNIVDGEKMVCKKCGTALIMGCYFLKVKPPFSTTEKSEEYSTSALIGAVNDSIVKKT